MRDDPGHPARSTREGQPPSFSRELHLGHSVLELDPSHPVTRGGCGLRLELDAETIVDLEVRLGFLHRGFEQECEAKTWTQAIPYVDRVNGGSAILCTTAYCLAVEKLLDLETPIRSHWLRVLGCELTRIGEHCARIAMLCQGLGSSTGSQIAFQARGEIRSLLEQLCGARVTSHFVRIGGVSGLQPRGFAKAVQACFVEVERALGELDTLLTRNRIFMRRLEGTGVLSADDCVRHALTGPILRAAGVAFDLRKDQPYLVYDQIEFSVPLGSAGDNYDRYLICVEEIAQSIRISNQCVEQLEALGTGDCCSVDARVAESDPVPAGASVPPGDAYAAVESANGELGFFVVSDGSQTPSRVHCRAPSLLNLQALPTAAVGGELADLVPTVDLIYATSGEADR